MIELKFPVDGCQSEMASRNISFPSAHALGGRDRVKDIKVSSDLDTKKFMDGMEISNW
jgi:hypothetical protein